MNLSRLSIIILIIFVGASVCAGASAHNDEDDSIMDLVKTVVGGTSKTEELNALSPEVDGILSDLCTISALNSLIDAYESADFYASGNWGADGKTYTSMSYAGRLPSYTMADFCCPTEGKITSLYGYRDSFHRMHKGVDIALKVGDPVVAALPGVVGRIGYEPGGYGHFVILVHSDGLETRYAHLHGVTAALGQTVAAGDRIAIGGNTGNSTGPHLHFEVRKQGKALDPLLVFQQLLSL